MYFIQLNESKVLSFEYPINIKIISEIFTFLFWIKPFKPGMHFTLTVHLDSNHPCFECPAACG